MGQFPSIQTFFYFEGIPNMAVEDYQKVVRETTLNTSYMMIAANDKDFDDTRDQGLLFGCAADDCWSA